MWTRDSDDYVWMVEYHLLQVSEVANGIEVLKLRQLFLFLPVLLLSKGTACIKTKQQTDHVPCSHYYAYIYIYIYVVLDN